MSDLTAYLDMLFAAEPADGLIEVRRLPSGRQTWHDCRDRSTIARLLEREAQREDVFAGVAPRRRRSGGRDAVERVHALWVDLDTPESIAALETFSPAPSIVINSGTDGHRHAYWSLWPPAGPDEVEQANRRLAHALGADSNACDAARILRPPGTLNHKAAPPAPVELEHLEAEVYTVEQVVGELPDPPERRREPRRARPVEDGADPLLAIPPPLYIEVLTGRQVGRDGKTECPFHDDSTPSLHAYAEPELGWCCFGCRRGGTIIDIGAALYGIEPRGRGYHELRERLERELLGALRAAA